MTDPRRSKDNYPSLQVIKRQKSQDAMKADVSKSRKVGPTETFSVKPVKLHLQAGEITKMQDQMNKLQQIMQTQIANLKNENELLRKDLFKAKKELGQEKQQMAHQITRLQSENTCLQGIIKQYFDEQQKDLRTQPSDTKRQSQVVNQTPQFMGKESKKTLSHVPSHSMNEFRAANYNSCDSQRSAPQIQEAQQPPIILNIHEKVSNWSLFNIFRNNQTDQNQTKQFKLVLDQAMVPDQAAKDTRFHLFQGNILNYKVEPMEEQPQIRPKTSREHISKLQSTDIKPSEFDHAHDPTRMSMFSMRNASEIKDETAINQVVPEVPETKCHPVIFDQAKMKEIFGGGKGPVFRAKKESSTTVTTATRSNMPGNSF